VPANELFLFGGLGLGAVVGTVTFAFVVDSIERYPADSTGLAAGAFGVATLSRPAVADDSTAAA
jgi:hypothetical protein